MIYAQSIRSLEKSDFSGMHRDPLLSSRLSDFRNIGMFPSCQLYKGANVDKMIHLATLQVQSGHTYKTHFWYILTLHLMYLKSQMENGANYSVGQITFVIVVDKSGTHGQPHLIKDHGQHKWLCLGAVPNHSRWIPPTKQRVDTRLPIARSLAVSCLHGKVSHYKKSIWNTVQSNLVLPGVSLIRLVQLVFKECQTPLLKVSGKAAFWTWRKYIYVMMWLKTSASLPFWLQIPLTIYTL